MKFFLDTANLEAIKSFLLYGLVDGVTTNPSIIAKEGVNLETRIKEICEVVTGPVSCEVTTLDPHEMVEQGKAYAKWAKNIYVKLPMTPAGIMACHELTQEGISTNVTLVFSVNQAIIAAKAGATVISPFVGRLDDISHEGMDLIAEIVNAYNNYDFSTEVLVASIRHPRHISQAAALGADIATMPPEVLTQLFKHPLTDIGQEKFLKDWMEVSKKG